MNRRGVTLIELMVASAIGMVIIAGVLGAGLHLQRQGMTEERRMQSQLAARAAAEVLTQEITSAGLGIGSSRVNLGGANRSSALAVTTDDPFGADATFAAPAAPYAAMTSDSVTIMTGDASLLINMGCCGGGGGGAGCTGCRMRNGANACALLDAPGAINGREIVFVNPALGVSCLATVTGVNNRIIQTTPGRGNNNPPPGDPCEEASGSFWCTNGAMALQVATSVFRVNWAPRAPGLPQRPRLQRDPDGPGAAGWQDILLDVEQLRLRFGVVNFGDGSLTWFPDAAAGRPPLDQCTMPTCAIPGGVLAAPVGPPTNLAADVFAVSDGAPGMSYPDDEATRIRLERRVRMVEVSIVTRSPTVDRQAVEPLGADGVLIPFRIDDEGFPRDGYSRRRWTFVLSPRNFRMAGEP